MNARRILRRYETCHLQQKSEVVITLKKLKSILRYDGDTGQFIWLERKVRSKGDKVFNTRYAGNVAGRSKPDAWGYNTITIRINGVAEYYRAHILAWFYFYGSWPPIGQELDHVNRDRWDNRIENLRLATRSQNNLNSKISRRNTSGVKGVCWDAVRSKWRAEIKRDGEVFHLGRYDDFEVACEVRRMKAVELFGSFAAETQMEYQS